MKGFIIGNEVITKDRTFDILNPATEEVIEKVSLATKEDVKYAIETANKAFEEWSTTPLYKRIELLYKLYQFFDENKENFARIIALEAGKPIRDARTEALRASRVFLYTAEAARFLLTGESPRLDAFEYPVGNENRIAIVKREPIGIVVAIPPFNFPIISLVHKITPALAVGNTVVVKPSISTPLTALTLVEAMLKIGFPPGVVNVVTGLSSEIGDELISHKDVSLITFTGSTETGLKIASKAASLSKRLIMELGGSDPFIVLEDADVEKASTIATRARFEYAGQNCNSAKRFIVHERVYESFIKNFKEKVARLNLGNPLEEKTDVGPLINAGAVITMQDFLEDALNKGGELVIGGDKYVGKGFFFYPTIIKNVSLEAKAINEEVFGPIAPVIKVKDDEEAIAIANATKYGLQAALFTQDYKKALKLADKIKAGAVIINDSTRLRWDALPFGGVKFSGFGREGIKYAIEEMTELKVIAATLS